MKNLNADLQAKLEKLKIQTEQKLAQVAYEAGNAAEIGIQKSIVETQESTENMLQAIDEIITKIQSEKSPENKCHVSQYINCVVHHNYTYSQGLTSKCATNNLCSPSFLSSPKIENQVQ